MGVGWESGGSGKFSIYVVFDCMLGYLQINLIFFCKFIYLFFFPLFSLVRFLILSFHFVSTFDFIIIIIL